jgi:hypothetical protein
VPVEIKASMRVLDRIILLGDYGLQAIYKSVLTGAVERILSISDQMELQMFVQKQLFSEALTKGYFFANHLF